MTCIARTRCLLAQAAFFVYYTIIFVVAIVMTIVIVAITGVLVLEELEHAKARGVPILAEYLGGSFTCDAYNMTEPLPNGKGVSSCIER